MPRWRSIWLVARREILERGRSRGFLLSVAFTTLIVVGSFIVPAIVFGGDNPTRVGIVQPSPPGLQAAVEQSAQRFDHKVAITTYPDAGAADAALDGGSVEVVVEMPADLSGPGEIRVKRQPDQATPRSSLPRPSRCGSRPSSAAATSTRRRSPTRSDRPKPHRSRPRPSRTRRSSSSPTSGRS
jgi:ABC-type Na+ efflux pump permease subunit